MPEIRLLTFFFIHIFFQAEIMLNENSPFFKPRLHKR